MLTKRLKLYVYLLEGDMKGLHETHFIIIPVKILPLLMPRRRAEK